MSAVPGMMCRTRLVRTLATLSVAVLLTGSPLGAQGVTAPSSPSAGAWSPPRTPWGDPDVQGVFSNADEYGLPFERPAEFEGKRVEDFSATDMARMAEERRTEIVDRAPQVGSGALGVPTHWFEFYGVKHSRPWMVVDPADGKVPALVEEGRKRAAARTAARRGRGPADSYTDRSLYDRCITRGLPGSMMPAQYGSAYEIVQGPGYVAIVYEMVHETRVIPFDGRPHVAGGIRQYMGDARGRWEGDTLVVETSNFTDQTAYRGSSDQLTMVERFTPTGPDTMEWKVTFTDSATWATPWSFALTLTRKADSQRPFEYACHEGNYGLANILSAARAEERSGAAAAPASPAR